MKYVPGVGEAADDHNLSSADRDVILTAISGGDEGARWYWFKHLRTHAPPTLIWFEDGPGLGDMVTACQTADRNPFCRGCWETREMPAAVIRFAGGEEAR